MKEKIIVVGASGAVGSAITKHLDNKGIYNIVVAGRRLATLENLKGSLQHDVEVLQLDINKPGTSFDFLKDAALLIMCVDIPNTIMPQACIDNNVRYMDISASQRVLLQLQALEADAKLKQLPMLFSVGLAPGLTNLLAQKVLNELTDATSLEIYVMLGLGEVHGDQAFQWTFDNLHKTYSILQNGKATTVKSFTQGKSTELLGSRKFYLFDFVDQHIFKAKSGLQSVSTRLAFDNKFFTGLVALMRSIGMTKMYQNSKIQKALMRLLKNVKMGSDVYGVKARALQAEGKVAEAAIWGYAEGEMTALVAAQLVPHFLASPKSGLLHSHELLTDIDAFLNEIKLIDNRFQMKQFSLS